MTNPPYYGPPQAGPWPPPAPKPSRAPLILAFVGIFIAIALAIGGWFRPTAQAAAPPADAAPTYSDQQVADAKTAVCGPHDLVGRATQYSGTQQNDDPTLKYVIAVNNRLAGALSGEYFLAKLDQYPATPADLSAATKGVSRSLIRKPSFFSSPTLPEMNSTTSTNPSTTLTPR
jgi:hypothetical protein